MVLISKKKLLETIHYIPNSGLVYVNNAKSGCSTIKKTLWTWASPSTYDPRFGPHDRQNSPFCNDLSRIDLAPFLDAKFLSVVRNPYVRILSAYLDKIAGDGRDLLIWYPFAHRFQLRGDAQLTFREFLELVVSEENDALDEHFAPQHINILQTIVTPDILGHLENMHSITVEFAKRGIQLCSHIPHSKNSMMLIDEYYGPHENSLVYNYYRSDFDFFGYGESPKSISPVSQPNISTGDRRPIQLLIQAYTADHRDSRRRCVDALGTLAPNIDLNFVALEAGFLDLGEVLELGKRALQGEFGNWRLVARIGQELAAQNAIPQARSLLERAQLIMNVSHSPL